MNKPFNLRRVGVSCLLLCLMLATLAACLRIGADPTRDLDTFVLTGPAGVIGDQPFRLSVRAVGLDGADPLTTIQGQVFLTLDNPDATISPGTLEIVDGVGSSRQFTINGAVGPITITAAAAGKSATHSLTVSDAAVATELPGDPDDEAAEAIPELAFTPKESDYSADHPELGDAYVSFNTLLLAFELGTTVGEANAILASIGAEIVGGVSGENGVVSGILILRVPTSDHDEMTALIEELRANDKVAHAVPDSLLEQEVVSGPNGGNPGDWTWGVTPGGGNWGLELVRVPQMWNFNEVIDASGQTTVTGVFDVGFADAHADLTYLENQTPGNQHRHGTHVAGTIGADFDNDAGVDGVNPFADLVVRTLPNDLIGGSSVLEVRDSFGAAFLAGFADFVRSRDDIRVINISMGYNWGPAGVNQNTNAAAQEMVAEHGALFRTLLIILGNEGDVPLIVPAAGNDSNDGFGVQAARWGSPFNYAGLVLDPPDVFGVSPIIVVESVQNDVGGLGGATRSGFSNTGGHISAPGSNITSTSWATAYESMSGTSMAAPHVTGLISYLLTLDPTLSHGEIRELLFSNGVPVGGDASNRIDAFATVLDIDRIRDSDDMRRALLDVNGDAMFDDTDVDDFLNAFDDGDPDDPVFSRFDLNGDGLTGGDGVGRFDLDRDGNYAAVTRTIEGEDVTFNQTALSDLMVLCYFAYSALYDGSAAMRTAALGDVCAPVTVTLPPGEPVVVDVTVDLPDPSEGEVGADVMFNVDLSGSYGDDLATFQSEAAAIVSALQDSISDLRMGVSSFSDAPCASFGSIGSSDFGHRLDLPLTGDNDAFQEALDGLSIYFGADGPESQLESMYQSMTGAGFEVTDGSACDVEAVDIEPASAGWAEDRLRFLLHATDARFHRPGDTSGGTTPYPYPSDVADVIEVAQFTGTRIHILDSGGGADSAKTEIAEATGGGVHLLSRSSSGVVDAVREAAETAITSATIRLVPSGDDAGFVESITPALFEDVDLTTTDSVTFEVTFVNTVTPEPFDQVFRFEFAITVDGAVVERRPVVITIPAE